MKNFLLTSPRNHEQSPNFQQSDELEIRQRPGDFATKHAEAAQAYRRWTVLWRSIVLSSIDDTKVSNDFGLFESLSNLAVDFQAILPILENARLPQPDGNA